MNNGWNFVLGFFCFYLVLETYKKVSAYIKSKKRKKRIPLYIGFLKLQKKDNDAFKRIFFEMPFREQQLFLSSMEDEEFMTELFNYVYSKTKKYENEN